METTSALNAGSTSRPDPDNLIVAVIVSAGPSPEESDLCRIDIHLRRPVLGAVPGTSSPHLEPDQGRCCAASDGRRADIVVEHLPEGPTIRHLVRRVVSD